MKKVLPSICFLVLLPFLGQANEGIEKDVVTEYYLKTFLSVDESANASIASSFSTFLNKLDKKHASIKNEKEFLHHIFSKTHQHYLKNFAAYTSFNAVFKDGSYNCLTGTILYSLILNHFNIRHEVIETNYHIFILAETDQGQVLIEATDPVNGFVNSTREIEDRITLYKQNIIRSEQVDKAYYQFRFELFNSVSMNELRGLLYYNMAVDSFNKKNVQKSIEYLTQANTLYSSLRIDEFSQILLLSLQQSNNLDQSIKEEFMKSVLALRLQPVIIASK